VSSLHAGLLLNDRYRVDALLAIGGMAEIWQAHDALLSRTVAVKALRPGDRPDAADRLRAEGRTAAMLTSDRVVKVYDVGELSDGEPFLVLELIHGRSLRDVLQDDGALSASRLEEVLAQVSEALVEAHALGLVHRDIKPANVLVNLNGDCKLTDFGISSLTGSASLTGTGLVMGTARYLSPEQVSGQRATGASDIYSLGVLAHEALRGLPMYHGESDLVAALAHVHQEPPPLPASVTAGLASLIGRMLAKDPAERPTAAQVLAALESPATMVLPTPTRALPVGTRAIPLTVPLSRRSRRVPALLVSGLGVLLITVLALVTGGSSAFPDTGTSAPSPTPTTVTPSPAVSPTTLVFHPSATPATTAARGKGGHKHGPGH
jgi:serine/threonine protein kinase